MDDFKAVVKVENASDTFYNMRRMFSVVGEEPELYPHHTAVPAESHCFLRFSSPVLANHALNLRFDIKDIRVLPVYGQPDLIEQYRRANLHIPSAGPSQDLQPNAFNTQQYEHRASQGIPTLTELDRDHMAARRRKSRRNDYSGPKRRSPAMTLGGMNYFTQSEQETASAAAGFERFQFMRSGNWDPIRAIVSNAGASQVRENATSAADRNQSEPIASEDVQRPLSLCVSSAESAPPAATFPISCETRISLELFGEIITYDLKGLDPDPRCILELLKVTKSERANYMLVGAFYRRSGKPQSAKAVMKAMLEEFTKRGVSASDLKPVFLFLSGCETDLAKRAKAEGKDASGLSGHYASAQMWLQKAFGKADPLRAETEHKENSPRQAKADTATKSKEETNKIDSALLNRDINNMEREIQSLRDRNANQAMQLSRFSSLKRKLEDDYIQERSLRRKYQGQLDTVEKERDAARRMEKYALDQIKREVSARRQAEETERALRLQIGGKQTRVEGIMDINDV